MKNLVKFRVIFLLSVAVIVFGLIACFANTQSIVSILLAWTLSTVYAVMLGDRKKYSEMIEKSFEEVNPEFGDLIADILWDVIIVLTVISTIGLFSGLIEPSFINIFLPSWVVLTYFIRDFPDEATCVKSMKKMRVIIEKYRKALKKSNEENH